MTAEGAIIGGLAVISALLGYFAFNLNDSENEVNRKIALLLALMSLIFLNLVMFAVHEIADQNASYLVSGVMNTGLLAMMWLTLILVFVLGASLFVMLIRVFWDMFVNFSGKKRRDDET